MATAANKTQPTDGDVDAFLDGVEHEERRRDARAVCALMADATGQPATMWGPSMVGFGHHHYRYESGREGDTFVVGFAPRKAQLVLYLTGGLDVHDEALAKLGPHSRGKGCLYVKHLDAVDLDVLRAMITSSYASTTHAS